MKKISWNNIFTSKSNGAQVVKPLLRNVSGCHFYHLAVYTRLTFPAGSVSPFPSKQAGEAGAALRSLITTDPTSLHPSFSDSHFISMKGHFHCLAWRMPLKYEPGGLPRYAEVRLIGILGWALLKPRAHYICTCDKLTQLLAALIRFFFCIHHQHGTLLKLLQPGLVFVLYPSVKNHSVACLQSGSMKFWISFLFDIYERFSFYSKEVCVWCTQQINAKKRNICVKLICLLSLSCFWANLQNSQYNNYNTHCSQK